mmetsp:Transcript_21548/g.32919  ORF Transcript_21548/g.32919 Transcript_21548/m.32919 type:complete len:125 (-) Transcript_21548:292-666(-)
MLVSLQKKKDDSWFYHAINTRSFAAMLKGTKPVGMSIFSFKTFAWVDCVCVSKAHQVRNILESQMDNLPRKMFVRGGHQKKPTSPFEVPCRMQPMHIFANSGKAESTSKDYPPNPCLGGWKESN